MRLRFCPKFPHVEVMGGVCFLRTTYLCLAVICSASATDQIKYVKAGENAVLTCHAKDYMPFEVVEWSRCYTGSENVLIYCKQNLIPKITKKDFENRVELNITENGHVSLILKKAITEDSGIYKCYAVKNTIRTKRNILPHQPISTINLQVSSALPPPGRGRSGLIAGPMVIAMVATLSIFVWKKRNVSVPYDDTVKSLQA